MKMIRTGISLEFELLVPDGPVGDRLVTETTIEAVLIAECYLCLIPALELCKEHGLAVPDRLSAVAAIRRIITPDP